MNLLCLNKGADRRLRGGHLWIYSNEVDVRKSPLKSFNPGEQVLVQTNQGKAMGVAMMNPQNLICGRMVNREAVPLDQALLQQRIRSAQALREQCFDKPFYRLVFGESDYLPGLVIDRFGDYFCVQTNTAGMDCLKAEVVDTLERLFSPKGILLKNDSSSREQEGLAKEVGVAAGVIPDRVELEENHTRFVTSLTSGQKTGWFYDHRTNRRDMQGLVKGKCVLDVFSYVGGWGIQALHAGAQDVVCVDSSQPALDMAAENAALNGLNEKFSAICGLTLDVLKTMVADKRQFDVVVLDPPAFVKKAKDKKKGEEAYHHHNQLALRLLKPEGLLISSSCSMHFKREELMNVIRVAGSQLNRELQVIHQGGQGLDHPVHPAIAET